jgi:hypothetical protein
MLDKILAMFRPKAGKVMVLRKGRACTSKSLLLMHSNNAPEVACSSETYACPDMNEQTGPCHYCFGGGTNV